MEKLRVHETFCSIQGEGPFAGQPAFFIRLSGCNLRCPQCDTDHTKQTEMPAGQLLGLAATAIAPNKLVVITGGEPFCQQITPLTNALLSYGYRVQVETNGTLFNKTFPYDRVTIVCSPKTKDINQLLVPHIDAYKYVVKYGDIAQYNGLPTNVLGMAVKPHVFKFPSHVRPERVYIQPVDEKDERRNKDNLIAALDICERFGYTLCLQIHKIIGKE